MYERLLAAVSMNMTPTAAKAPTSHRWSRTRHTRNRPTTTKTDTTHSETRPLVALSMTSPTARAVVSNGAQ